MAEVSLTFIIPTRSESLAISPYDTWASIRKFHPAAKIYIVDSASSYVGYKDLVNDKNTEVLMVENKNYDIGAYLHAIKHDDHKSDCYICIHDSVTLKQPIKINTENVRIFYSFSSFDGIGSSTRVRRINPFLRKIGRLFLRDWPMYGFDNESQRLFALSVLRSLSLSLPAYFTGVFGPMLTLDNDFSRQIVTDFKNVSLPTNKNEQKAFERILGIYLENKGINLRAVSIEGDFLVSGLNSSRYINKVIRNRS